VPHASSQSSPQKDHQGNQPGKPGQQTAFAGSDFIKIRQLEGGNEKDIRVAMIHANKERYAPSVN
jgi:hypothetical protein